MRKVRGLQKSTETSNRKPLLVDEKGDVGMAKCFKRMETRDELSTTYNPKVMSRCLSAPDTTSNF